MQRKHLIGVVLAGAVACGGGSSTDGGGDGGGAPITATVNGHAFVGNTSTIATRNSGVINLSAFNAAKNQEILITVHADATGPYTFGSDGSAIAEYETMTETSAPQWTTGLNGATGSINFSTLTATGATGSFSFTGAAVPGTGASGTASVSGGTFSVTF